MSFDPGSVLFAPGSISQSPSEPELPGTLSEKLVPRGNSKLPAIKYLVQEAYYLVQKEMARVGKGMTHPMFAPAKRGKGDLDSNDGVHHFWLSSKKYKRSNLDDNSQLPSWGARPASTGSSSSTSPSAESQLWKKVRETRGNKRKARPKQIPQK